MPNTSVPAAATGLPAYAEPSLAKLARLRAEAEAQIERLLSILDAIDGDADIEEGDDEEPALGWQEEHPGQGASPFDKGAPWDLEHSDGDEEPSLGWFEGRISQVGGNGGSDDLEDGI